MSGLLAVLGFGVPRPGIEVVGADPGFLLPPPPPLLL
jgi:hypothetical protein